MSAVKSLQLHNLRNCALIEMRSLEAAENLAALHNLQHSMEADQKKFLIPVYLEDTAVNVRILDLPPDMANAVIAEHMKAYGKVRSVAREMWKNYFQGIPNGVRVVRMEIEKPIPSYITIGTELTTVVHKNQTPTCRYCERQAHPKQTCSEVAKEERPKQKPTTCTQARTQVHQTTQQPHQSTSTGGNEQHGSKKRERSPSALQTNECVGFETNIADGQDKNQDNNEWIQYHSKRMDKIIAKNNAQINYVNKVLNK